MATHSGALGVQSRRQFVRYGPVLLPSLAWWSMRSQPTLRHSGQSGDLSVRGGGCAIHGVAIRLLMLSAQAHSHGGQALPLSRRVGRW